MDIKNSGLAIGFLFILGSCEEKGKENPATISNVQEQTEIVAAPEFEVKAYQVKDSAKNTFLGWGYDIYINGTRSIHQPLIPGMQGNNYFKTESDALKTGNFAANKMKSTGSLPSLSLQELDSLGIIKH